MQAIAVELEITCVATKYDGKTEFEVDSLVGIWSTLIGQSASINGSGQSQYLTLRYITTLL